MRYCLTPLLAPGSVVGDDLVLAPDLTVRPDQIGLTTAMPRYALSDAIAAPDGRRRSQGVTKK